MTASNLRDRRLFLTGLLFILTALFATLMLARAGVAEAKDTTVINRAALAGSTIHPAVTGAAKWKSKGAERELEVQIQNAVQLKGKTLGVRINGKLVGKMRVSALGRARLVRSTAAGQTVPVAVLGKRLTIKTAAGVLVAAGVFRAA